MTEPYYRAVVVAGSLGWSVTSNDAPDYGLADPLIIEWACPENGQPYAQPEPWTAEFNLIVASIASVDALDVGQPVTITVQAYPPGTINPNTGSPYEPAVYFEGRVTAISAKPHALGMLVNVSCIDLTVDLAETIIHTVDWPAETVASRLLRISDELGLPTPLEWAGAETWPLAAKAATSSPARGLIVELLDQLTDVAGASRPILVPHPASNPDRFYLADMVFTSPTAGTGPSHYLPALLAETSPNVFGIVIDPKGSSSEDWSRVIDACHVPADLSWIKDKTSKVDTAIISGTFSDGTTQVIAASDDPVPVSIAKSVELTSRVNALALAESFLREHDTDSWLMDKFTWLVDNDPTQLFQPVPLMHQSYPFQQAYIVAVDDIPPARNPTGPDWYAGQFAACRFTIAKGRYSIEVTLRRNLPRAQGTGTAGALRWNSNDLDQSGGVKWSELDPQFSWFDFRIVREDV